MRVFVLGSGESCLKLDLVEIDKINSSEVSIAINKFALFAHLIGIRYTHIYFNDIYGLNIYIETIKSLHKDSNLTIITNFYLANLLYTSYLGLLKSVVFDGYYRLRSIFVSILRLGNPGRSHELIINRKFEFYRVGKKVRLDVIKTTAWDDMEAKWATEPNEPLYSYRGSLTSVLNYISVKYPGFAVKCVGTDFNGSKYFYEDELRDSGIEHEDHTTSIVKKKGIHFSFHNISQGKLSDAFPKILNAMEMSGNTLSCNNKDSLLIKECRIKYKSVLND